MKLKDISKLHETAKSLTAGSVEQMTDRQLGRMITTFTAAAAKARRGGKSSVALLFDETQRVCMAEAVRRARE